MKIDLTCPVELWQYAMPTQEDAECTFVMNNLSDKVVISVQVALACYDAEDELIFRQSERISGLKAGVGERFTVVILPSEWQGVEGVDLVIEKVWFDDSTIWRKGNAPLAHYTSNALSAGRALDELRFVAGKDAVGYPQVQEQVWVCVCGRANAPDSDRCCRCERRREAVFASFSRENVAHVVAAHEKKLAEAARKVREENNILQENQEKQRAAQRRKRKQRIRLLTACLIAAVAVVIAVVWGIPTVRYNTALDLLGDGHYDQARAAFSEMGDWKDSQTQLLECDYRKAQSLLEAGDQASLQQAEELFLQLKDYQQSADMARQSAYALGKVYLEAGSYEAAAEKFQNLGDYQDSAAMMDETVYRQASDMLKNGNYAAARVLLGTLGEYKDAAKRMDECTYRMGEKHMDAGEYEAAISELSKLDDYEDADELVKQAYYAMAENAMKEGSYGNAGQWYQLAGDYSDAEAKANDCIYQHAQQTKAAGDYAAAKELFERIPGYLDSEGQAQTCVYAQAEALMQSEDYAGAAELFAQIAAYGDSQTRLDECNYIMAMAALEAGDAAQAESILGGLVDYEDAQKQLRTVRYQLAQNDLEAENYESALERYEALDNYRDSKTKAKQCRYAIAEAALTAGEYQTAIDAFAALGSYKQSRDKLEEAQYQQAMALLKKGETQSAVALLEQMEDSKRAQQALDGIAMEEAAALEAAGKLEEAALMYEAMGSDEAKQRAKACRYALAVQLKEAGDLPGAGAAFEALGSYEDSKEQSAQCWDAYYGDAAQNARTALDKQDYPAVIAALEGMELNEDMQEVYSEACYQQAEKLYDEDKPYEALSFYLRAGDYRDINEKKLDRRVYLILGQWQSTTGKLAAFRADGTCDILDETLYFRVSNFSLFTGKDAESMTLTHKLSTIDEKGMTLRDIRDGQDTVYKFSRVGDYDLSALAQPQPVQETIPQAQEELLVTEEQDEAQ